jgi:putative ABC transport system substrate-binding protein
MRRREFIAGLGIAAALPITAGAQQQAMPVIGGPPPASADDYKIQIAAFLQGLKETGFVAGQNVVVEYRYAENQLDWLPALAVDLVRRSVGFGLSGKASRMFGSPPSRSRIFCAFNSPRWLSGSC